jgi:hypothetical protein
MEIFLYYCKTLGINNRGHGTIPVLSWDNRHYYRPVWKYFYIIMDPGSYYQTHWKDLYIIVGPQELSLYGMEIFLYFRESL